MTTTSRTQVRQGIAAYLGGTWQPNIQGYSGGNLNANGVGIVRAGWSKKLNMQDYVANVGVGRGMGCYIVVDFGREREYRRGIGGPPVTDGGGNIISGGTKFIEYRVTLHCFHMAQVDFAEKAQADVDLLIEAIKYQIRKDRTLGMPGVMTDAGETPFGIQTSEAVPGVDANGRVGTFFTIQFDARAQIVS